MLLALLAFLGGAMTIISPCILPVLPFVFARSNQSFTRSALPLLAGMALTFAAIATLASVGGAWAVRINAYGRVLALVLLAAFGLALLSKRFADWLARPFVALGNRLMQSAGTDDRANVLQSAVLGVATGLLWAPCAGPILGLILTGAALNGPNTQTTLLLFAYALGAVTSLALATLAGNRVFNAMKRSFGAGDWVRRGLGVLVLAAVAAIGLGWDTGLLTRLSAGNTNSLEQKLIDAVRPASARAESADTAMASNAKTTDTAMTDSASATTAMTGTMAMSGKKSSSGLPIEGELPELSGAGSWLNSSALTAQGLRGKVVLIDFWTYSCINCLRTLPYLKAWYQRYKDHGLVIIGVHAPEFAFEKDEGNVRRAIKELGIEYPVALDNDYAIWQAFNNQYWPAHYFIDAQGRIRGHHFGEGNYEQSERLIRTLLTDAGQENLPGMAGEMNSSGAQVAADENNVGSPETYVGYERAQNFASPGSFSHDKPKSYAAPGSLRLNQWGLGGTWTVAGERATLNETRGKIVFRFHARDLHLVLGPGADGKPIRFRVTVDGQDPGQHHGTDIDARGEGTVREQRLYQLIRQSGDVKDRTFSIEFLDTGVQAYAFTFG
ncbi:MAG TPA: cytochrome c biogenesis protein DipZ [Steroidobacteraceae bacterium]|nr:cytochrome c biogenesis protein DipZ [Steroidobacteraceae bacterium]